MVVRLVAPIVGILGAPSASGVFYVRARAVESWGAFSEDVKTALDEAKLSGSILDAFTVGIHGWE